MWVLTGIEAELLPTELLSWVHRQAEEVASMDTDDIPSEWRHESTEALPACCPPSCTWWRWALVCLVPTGRHSDQYTPLSAIYETHLLTFGKTKFEKRNIQYLQCPATHRLYHWKKYILPQTDQLDVIFVMHQNWAEFWLATCIQRCGACLLTPQANYCCIYYVDRLTRL